MQLLGSIFSSSLTHICICGSRTVCVGLSPNKLQHVSSLLGRNRSPTPTGGLTDVFLRALDNNGAL